LFAIVPGEFSNRSIASLGGLFENRKEEVRINFEVVDDGWHGGAQQISFVARLTFGGQAIQIKITKLLKT
jgi:hypothetical protein